MRNRKNLNETVKLNDKQKKRLADEVKAFYIICCIRMCGKRKVCCSIGIRKGRGVNAQSF